MQNPPAEPIRRGNRLRAGTILMLIGLAVAMPAEAHNSATLAGGFLAGFSHPLGGPDHLLAMVAVGLWGSILGRPLIVLLPVVFPTVMALGALLAMAGAPLPPIELGIAISVLALGLAIALRFRAPMWLASLIVAIFAIFHGYAHGNEIPSLADPIAYSTGFMLATGGLHLAGIGLGLLDHRRLGRTAIRSMGGGIALAGVYFLARAITG